MTNVSNANFGPLIAYLIPGVTVLAGLSPFSPTLQSWFATAPENTPTLGGFLYLTVAALTAGMTVSAVRWALLDTVHRRTGLPPPPIDFSRLGKNVEAFGLLIRIHYEHYLFYSNMVLATALAYGSYRASLGGLFPVRWLDVAFIAVEIVFYATSRDTLRKYHTRSEQILSARGGAAPSSRSRPRKVHGLR